MTEKEAVEVLDGFRKAFRALDQNKARQALMLLLGTPGVVTTAHSRIAEFGGALATLRTVFDELDRKQVKFRG